MPLEPIQLDDVTWSDLTTAARSRIAGVSNGEWTLHAPVDPGITLLELFAAQLDQRVYWMDQPSDELKAAMLSLLSIQPRPVRVAGTVFCLTSEKSDGTGSIEAGSAFEQITNASPLRFTSDHTIQLLPIMWERIDLRASQARKNRVRKQFDVDTRLIVGGQDRSSDLKTGRLPCLLPADGSPCETRIAFPLYHIPTGKDPISLCLELDTPASVNPQWMPDPFADELWTEIKNADTIRKLCAEIKNPESIVKLWTGLKNVDKILKLWAAIKNPDEILRLWAAIKDVDEILRTWEKFKEFGHDSKNAQASLSWKFGLHYAHTPFENELSFQPLTAVDDGTLGFRRSGVIRFAAPKIESGLDSKRDSTTTLWLVLAVRDESKSRAFLPRVRQILPNAVMGHHQFRYKCSGDNAEDISNQIAAWRPLPANRLKLPLAEGHVPIPTSVDFKLREHGTEKLYDWSTTDNFSHHGPLDRSFVVDRGRATLIFGDGLNGRLPIPVKSVGDACFHLEFEVGGGNEGNVADQQRWRILSEQHSEFTAINVVPAQGGEDAETLDEAVRRSRSELRRPCRAVTKDDIEELARKTPGAGIKRARAAVGFHPQHPCVPTPGAVTVFIVPDLPPSLRRFIEQSCGDDLIAIQPDSGALRAVSERLNAARLVTHEIFVRPPVYEPIGLSVVISGTPADPDSVRESVTHALHEYLHPLYGGPNKDGWSFGYPLRPSELVRVVRDAIDQELQVKEVGIRKLEPEGNPRSNNMCATAPRCPDAAKTGAENAPRFESCSDVDIKANALVALRSVQITFGPLRAQTGGLL